MSILSTLLGNDAARTSRAAAQDTYLKQQNAINGLLAYGDTLPGQYKDIATAYDPYTSAGTDALSMYRAGLGLGGDQGAFTNAYQNLPGYQSGLATGQQAAERALNAGGGLNSGRALKALYRYGSDYENQRAGDYLNRLQGLTGMGLQATGAQTGLQAQGIGADTGIRQAAFGGQMGSAGTIGQGLVAGAQSQQDALGNLLKTAAYLGGSALGGGGFSPGKFFSPTGYGGGTPSFNFG